ncbi:MAG: DUF4340 domain-containing protein [Clostridia bacterium]|nr:DUF4340 domain-containing protein [Clostridia bacterium]
MSSVHDMLEPAAALRRPAKRRLPLSAAALMASLAFFLVCAAYAFLPGDADAPHAENASARAFSQLAPQGAGAVTALTLTGGGEAFTLQAREGAICLADEDTPLNQSAARELLQSGASIISRQTLHGDPADYGIDADALRAAYTYESGAPLTLILGDPVPTGEGWYAAAEGGDAVHVVNNALAATLMGGRQALYALPELGERFTANTLLSASIARPGEETITLERVIQENPFNTRVQFTSPIRYPANAERAAEVYLALETIRPTSVAAVGGSDADWGLDAPIAMLTLRDRQTTTLTIGQMGETYTLRISGDENVYTIDKSCLAFLNDVSVPYLAEQLPGLVMLSKTRRIDVTTPEETLTLTADPEADVYTIDGRALTRDVFVPAYQQMIGLLIERYVPQPEEIGEARIRLEYTFADGQRWQIAFARYDDQFDLVVREGCACFLVSRAKTDAMIDGLCGLK